MTSELRILIYLFMTTVFVAACSDSPSTMAPNPDESVTAAMAAPPPPAPAACPTLAEACDIIGAYMYAACPPDSTYAGNGYKKCRSAAFDAAFAPFEQCFAQNEERAMLRKCAEDWMADSGGGDGSGSSSGDTGPSVRDNSSGFRYSELGGDDGDRSP